jgi:peptide deformylase
MNLNIFINPYHTLHTVSTGFQLNDIPFGYKSLELFEHDLIHLMIHSRGMGLAANQIGITKRFFAIGHESFDVFKKPAIIYNPVLVNADEEQELGQEGCLSFPGVWAQVNRSRAVMVRYQNNKGEFLLSRLEGLEARCFQHELDHLDGITFDKRVSKLNWDMAQQKANR